MTQKNNKSSAWIIYKITNKINGKYYIGQTKTTEKIRWKKHIDVAIHPSKNYNTYFSKAIRKYGKENWKIEIIEKNIENTETADDREIFWIAIFCSNNPKFGYNSTSGGKKYISNQWVKDKISKSKIGKKRPPEIGQNLRKICLGKKPNRLTSSKYVGVCYKSTRKRPKKWAPQLTDKSGKILYLKPCLTEVEAAEAYNAKAVEIYGDEAILNVISQEDKSASDKVLSEELERIAREGKLSPEALKRVRELRNIRKIEKGLKGLK